MYEFLWFAAGCAVALPSVLWWTVRRRAEVVPPTISSTEPLVELYAESKRAERLETLATSIGREVADLTSSVEINASLLIEEIGGDPRVASERAGDLYRSVHRMRFFIHKLLSFAKAEPLPLGATDVTRLLLDVRRELEGRAGRSTTRSALYRTFDRLEDKGYLCWQLEDDGPVPDRGGHPMRRFWVTESGEEALRQSRTALVRLWEGLDTVFDGS